MAQPNRTVLARLMAVILTVLVSTGCEQSKPITDKLTLDQSLPDIVLINLSGESTHLAGLRGKVVILNVWATWCAPCRQELPSLQRLSNGLDSQRFAVIGLAQDDDPHVVREYLLDKKISFTSYIDADQQIAQQQLGVPIYPYTLIIAPDGTLIQRIPGEQRWDLPEIFDALQRAYDGDYSGLRSIH